jgi:hypothetical protein
MGDVLARVTDARQLANDALQVLETTGDVRQTERMLLEAAEQAWSGARLLPANGEFVLLSAQIARARLAARVAAHRSLSTEHVRDVRLSFEAAVESVQHAATPRTRAQVEDRLRELLSPPLAQLTSAQLREIRSLIAHVPSESRPLLRSIDKSKEMGDGLHFWTNGLEAHDFTSKFELLRLRNELQGITADSMRSALVAAMQRHPYDATPDDIREIHALMRPLPISTRLPREELVDLAPHAWKTIVVELAGRVDTEISDALYSRVLARSITSIKDATAFLTRIARQPTDRWQLQRVRAVLQHFPAATVAGDPATALKLAIAAGSEDGGFLDAIATQIRDIDRQLTHLQVDHPEWADTTTQLRGIARDNLDRIDGHRSDGYLNFPDYGELGDLISGSRLVKSLATGDAPSTGKSSISW